jgi:transcriptional regulator with XRE-family HTH domain
MLGVERILDQIRKAIRAGDKSRYRIAQETGIPESQLSRLMSGEKGLSIESLERLADCLGLEVTIRPKRRRKGR